MITPRHILGASLIISWALLISAHYICYAILLASPVRWDGIRELGIWLLVMGWSALVAGVALLVMQCKNCGSRKDGDTKNAAQPVAGANA